VEQWVELQGTIDRTRDYLIRAVPQAQFSIDEAQKILAQRTYTLVFFGGTGVGKSTLINALLGRNLLPTGAVTAVTGTIVYIEQADEGEAESLVLSYWSRTNSPSASAASASWPRLRASTSPTTANATRPAKTIMALEEGAKTTPKPSGTNTWTSCSTASTPTTTTKRSTKGGTPPPRSLALDNEDSLRHLREDGFKGSQQRQIRLIKSATFKIQPRAGRAQPADERLPAHRRCARSGRGHEAARSHHPGRDEARRRHDRPGHRRRPPARGRDEIAVGRQLDQRKSPLRPERRRFGRSGFSKIFLAVNGGNVRQAFDRLNSGLPEAELEVKEVTRYIAPNYWERYRIAATTGPTSW
jgi:hypothetical protein